MKKNIRNAIYYTDPTGLECCIYYMSSKRIGYVYAQRIVGHLGNVSRIETILIEG